MIERHAIHKLREWKNQEKRKPLLIRGARQVGKTTLVRAFSNEFETYIEVNLEKETDRRLFELPNTSTVLNAIYLAKATVPKKRSTLLFIDEIQESPQAISQLRFFYEEHPDIHIIAAGSLLEFALVKVPSFPVGRIDYLYLNPINFPEFLGAMKKQTALDALFQIPIPEYAHQTIKEHFHEYVMIGGMPAIVASYQEKKLFEALTNQYTQLWQSFKDDVEKYAKNDTDRRIIRHVIDTAPNELDRIKFEGFGNSNYRSREVGEALRALDMARLIRLVYPSTSLQPPMAIDYKKRPRLQFLDTGLWSQAIGLQKSMIQVEDLDEIHKGRVIQHLISQEINSTLSQKDYLSPFWVRQEKDANSEVDIVFPYGKYLIPVEVKAGASGSLRSLHQFIDRSEVPVGVRFYAGKLSIEKTFTASGRPFDLINLPYYLGTQLQKYLEYYFSMKK